MFLSIFTTMGWLIIPFGQNVVDVPTEITNSRQNLMP